MKKVMCFILMLLLVLSAFSGCSDAVEEVSGPEVMPMKFTDVVSFEQYAQSFFWVSDNGTSYKLCIFLAETEYCMMYDLKRSAGESISDMFVNLLEKLSKRGWDTNFESVFDFLIAAAPIDGFERASEEVEYDPDSGVVAGARGSTWTFLDNKTMLYKGTIYTPTDTLSELTDGFDSARLKSKYSDAVSHKDVRYDPYAYLGKNFVITGTVELDDYYNYDYSDTEHLYFCICIRPIGGSYTDQWYVYANRSVYSKLFNALKNGSYSNVTLVCKAQYINATKNNMATLVDYFVS